MSNRGTGSENENGMETAIELPLDLPRRRERNLIEKAMDGMIYWCLLFTSEGALTLYILFHWLLGCASHIVVSGDKKSGGDENASFFSFIYFMSTLVAFLSIMSHVSGLLIPLFSFSAFGAFFLFFLVNLSTLDQQEAKNLFKSICTTSNVTNTYYIDMNANPTATLIKSWIMIVFLVLTCLSILFQCARNEEYLRRPQPIVYPGFYPHMLPREMPVGSSNLDEPPRYSTLEPMPSPKSTVTRSSTVTSPPRYSYWERTFGRVRTSSEHSNREMMTAKSH